MGERPSGGYYVECAECGKISSGWEMAICPICGSKLPPELASSSKTEAAFDSTNRASVILVSLSNYKMVRGIVGAISGLVGVFIGSLIVLEIGWDELVNSGGIGLLLGTLGLFGGAVGGLIAGRRPGKLWKPYWSKVISSGAVAGIVATIIVEVLLFLGFLAICYIRFEGGDSYC